MHSLSALRPAHLDLLKELGNIGAGHAATALSQLLNKRLKLKIPAVSVATLAELNEDDAEKHVAAAYIRVDGELEGHFFMVFEAAHAEQLIQDLVPGGSTFDSEIGVSAFCEISNILCGSYLSALASFLRVPLNQSPPVFAMDMQGAIFGEVLAELSIDDNSVILINTSLYDCEKQNEWKGKLIFLPVPGSMDVIFNMIEGKTSM
ncbi:chemotaxis protein CheC [Sporolactobacillus sp. THM7-4]|nr:chemotaxis protein CheC [Sporolactobacillus sp. THM7-4]